MFKVTLYDDTNKRSYELESLASITLGRGIFECQDKRVSRNHGLLTVHEEEIKIKACHTNPIFYKTNGSNQIQVLSKDSEITLHHSDKFSLLPKEFEYEVRVIRNELSEQENLAGTSENDRCEETNVQQEIRVRNVLEINDNLQSGLLISSEAIGQSHSTEDVSMEVENEPSKNSEATRKRSLSNDNQEDENNKKSKLNSDEKLKDSNVVTSSTAVADQKANKNSVLTTVKVKTEPESQGSDTLDMPVPSSSNSSETPVIKTDPDSTSKIAIKTESENNSRPDSSNSSATAPLRPSCSFGIRCYRNTVDHRLDTAHPTDVDYRRPDFPPAPDDAPDCPFGASCYRRNPEHFQRLKHPPSSVYSNQPPPRVVNIIPVQNQVQNDDLNDHQDSPDEYEEDFDDSDFDDNYDPDENHSDDFADEDDDEENNLEE
ncbi:CLUMA_CG002592, isoform A [Clunio marinus]|uniref:CLUMA_CG002592, isoform A n=1 Tax=Clunio marinus TaxID=568069 RepID=A0A1J1HM81_9DIPT|nr:CLUMA_CG002592, isoform A [Clunio marinus]